MDEGLKWNLDDILKLEDFDALYKETEEYLDLLRIFFDKEMRPGMSQKKFKDYSLFEDLLIENLHRLSAFQALTEAADVKSEQAQRLKGRLKDIFTKYTESITKQCLWFQGIKVGGKRKLDRKNLNRLLKAVPDLAYVSSRKSELGEYTLSEAEETLDTAKDLNGIDVLLELREKIETGFEFEFKQEGQEAIKIDSVEELRKYYYSPDSNEREEAYRTMLEKYKENIDIFFTIYEARAKDWEYMAKRRGYESPIAVRNEENDVPDEAVQTLLQTCAENKTAYQDYFKWKAKELGIDKLRRCDIYAPLLKTKTEIPFQQGLEIVLDTLGKFSEGFAEKAKEIADAGHIDSHTRKNKSPGAFCCTISPRIVPYVFLNYTNTPRDVSTLAHELGHGIHSLYSRHHLCLSQDPSLPLAETASTLAEMIIFEKLFAEAPEEDRKAMLADKMAESYATVLRQSSFVEFEIKAHEAVSKGTTAEELSDIFFETLTSQFGDSIEIDPLFRYEWAAVPHFVDSPFYCYAYSFGDLLSLSLYSTYKEHGDQFLPVIEHLLEAGGSENPEGLLKKMGLDMNSKKFWQKSFDMIRDWQRQLESYK